MRTHGRAASPGLLGWFIGLEYPGDENRGRRLMLQQAHEMRALVVFVDGIDEAAGLRKDVEVFVLDELVASGNRVVVTSRPEGVRVRLFSDAGFALLSLSPLSEEQQRAVITAQLGESESPSTTRTPGSLQPVTFNLQLATSNMQRVTRSL